MNWFKNSDSLSWSPGHAGKGYQLHDGTIKSWNVDPYNPVDQVQVHQLNDEVSPIALRFEIDPDGGVVTDNPGSNVDAILTEDPHLYDAGQRPESEDDWDLKNFTPKPDKPGPDYNFIMSKWEWDSKFHSSGHYNRMTGLKCHCGWGGHGTKKGRISRVVTSDDLHMRKLRKAPDKALQTEEGQKFLHHLSELPDDWDSLRPYLAHRFKKGDFRYNEEATRPGAWNMEKNQRDEEPAPRFEYLKKREYQPWRDEATEHEPVWKEPELGRWHQWYEARQHPLRRGVNVMDKGFDPSEMEMASQKHKQALAEARKKETWLDEYARGGQYHEAPVPIHVFGPEAGPYKGYQVHQLDARQAEGDSEALGHCIGQDEQPYKHNIDIGNIAAFSLRDKEGYPKVSWHINPSGEDIGHMQGASGTPKPEYRNLISMFNKQHGLPDEEGHEDPLEDQYDDYYTFPAAQDLDDYNRWFGDEPDYDHAYDNGNIGENTEFDWEEPNWESMAQDYLGGAYGREGDDFHRYLRNNNPQHERFMADALRQEHDITDPDHREALNHWNNEIRNAGNEIDVPPENTDEVDKYNEAMDNHGHAEPDDWDALAQDYLEYPRHYGPNPNVDDPKGYDPYHDPTSPYKTNPRQRGEPGFYQRPTEYDHFHRFLRDNMHEDQMREALQRNVDWEDPDHQLAVDSWNKGNPKLNIATPAPEPEQPIPGQTQWNWPSNAWEWPQNPQASDPRPSEQQGQYNDYWNWNTEPGYRVPNNSEYIPRASAACLEVEPRAPFDQRVAEQRGWKDMYHASPRKNRESILMHGLDGAEMYSPWDEKEYRRHQQPPGNYLFDNPDDAVNYAWSTQGNHHGYHDTDADAWEDRYEQEEPPEDFHEWEPDQQDAWYEEHEPTERTEDPNGWDIYRVNARDLPLHRDPETSLVGEQRGQDQWSPHSLQKDFESRGDQYAEWDRDADPWQAQLGDSASWHGSEPRRYYIPDAIEPERMQLHQHVPAWDMTEENAMNRLDDMDETQTEVPAVWGQMNVRSPQFPAHSAVDTGLQPAIELREWLNDLGGDEVQPPSIHHDTPEDVALSPNVTQREGLPYIPPSEVSNYTQSSVQRLADGTINNADATNDPLGKSPALEPSRMGDPDYLHNTLCPHCQQLHRPDEPCADSAVTQFQQQERSWYNRDNNAVHTPEGAHSMHPHNPVESAYDHEESLINTATTLVDTGMDINQAAQWLEQALVQAGRDPREAELITDEVFMRR